MLSSFLYISEKISINQDVLEILNNFYGKKILITGCYGPLAKYMIEKLNIQFIFDEIYGTEVGYFNYVVQQHPYGRDKLKYYPNDSYLIGIGNAWSDRYYLNNCNQAFIISGNKKLERIAIRKKWKIIFEPIANKV